MAYRIRNFDNLSVHKVDEIFRRGRGIGLGLTAGASPREDEDFTSNLVALDMRQPIIPMPPAEAVDDELESVT